MVKETTVSKKRKNNPDNEQETDIYKKVVEFEEKEAAQRSQDEDTKIYFETCSNIRALLGDIFKLKSKGSDNQAEVIQKRTQACVHTALLKKLNRLEKVRMLTAREQLNVEKQKLDSINLQYQNLLYELAHLVSEYKKCKQYKSKDEDIELISVEQFLNDAPKDITEKFKDKDFDGNTKHELHLAMLEHELSQRIQLSELCGTLESQKKQLAKDIVSKKEKLEGLGPRLAAVIEATKPLQDQLGLPIDKIRAEHKLASLLPDELYLLYCNADAYKQVNDIEMTIEILGDQEEAVQYNEAESVSNDPESEPEVEVEEPTETKKRRHRKPSQADKHEEKKKKLLEAHPLSVEIVMAIPKGPALKIKFFYRTHLKIVTVLSNVDLSSDIVNGDTAVEVLRGESVLNELFESDFGKESPNSGNHFQLKKVGLGSFESLVPKLGYAYTWAQKICGLDFLDTQSCKDKANKISLTNVEAVLKAIQKRLKARFALALELQQLDLGYIIEIPDTIEYPKTAVTSLPKWSSINYQKFCQNAPNALQLVEMGIAAQNDMFYSLIVSRPKVTMYASVIIKNDYPSRAPIFILNSKFSGEHSAENSDEIRDLERAVNIGIEATPNIANYLLSTQIKYLCSFVDVYLDTTDGTGYTPTTVFFRHVGGRNRRRPFKFRKIGNGIFTQY